MIDRQQRRMRILIDMDEIVVNLLGPWLDVYNKEWNDDLQRRQIIDWEIHKFVMPACGKQIYEIIMRRGFFDHLQPYPGAVKAVKELAKRHDVRFCTHPPSADAALGKMLWVERHFGWGPDHVLMLHDKAWLSADILIDDKPDTIKSWAKKKDGSKIFTIGHPYNVDCEGVADFYAKGVYNMPKAWNDILEQIGSM